MEELDNGNLFLTVKNEEELPILIYEAMKENVNLAAAVICAVAVYTDKQNIPLEKLKGYTDGAKKTSGI